MAERTATTPSGAAQPTCTTASPSAGRSSFVALISSAGDDRPEHEQPGRPGEGRRVALDLRLQPDGRVLRVGAGGDASSAKEFVIAATESVARTAVPIEAPTCCVALSMALAAPASCGARADERQVRQRHEGEAEAQAQQQLAGERELPEAGVHARGRTA